MKTHDLNIGKILNWDISYAIREIIANAIDEQQYTQTKDIVIKQIDVNKWIIRDYGRGISQKNFILNENPEKLKNNLLIGKFGIGLKDALATFYKNNIKVFFKSKNGIFTIENLPKHNLEEEMVLHVIVNEPDDINFEGTEFIIEGITEKDLNSAKNLFLKYSNDIIIAETEYGQILEKRNSGGRIYINGIKVNTEEDFLFSYNIKPIPENLRKRLNRERENLGKSVYSPIVQKILLSTDNFKVWDEFLKLYKSDKAALKRSSELAYTKIHEKVIEKINENKNIVFVQRKDLENKAVMEKLRMANKELVLVDDNEIFDRMTKNKLLTSNPIKTVDNYEKLFDDNLKYTILDLEDLFTNEKEVFNFRKIIFNYLNITDAFVNKIYISEDLKAESPDINILGFWDPKTRNIIIHRKVLRDFKLFVKTLVHELAHAFSTEDHFTRKFEDALEEFIGRAFKHILQENIDKNI